MLDFAHVCPLTHRTLSTWAWDVLRVRGLSPFKSASGEKPELPSLLVPRKVAYPRVWSLFRPRSFYFDLFCSPSIRPECTGDFCRLKNGRVKHCTSLRIPASRQQDREPHTRQASRLLKASKIIQWPWLARESPRAAATSGCETRKKVWMTIRITVSTESSANPQKSLVWVPPVTVLGGMKHGLGHPRNQAHTACAQ